MRRNLMFSAVAVGLTLAAALACAERLPSAQASPPTPSATSSASPDRLSLPPPRPGHARPLVVILADNAATETTDFTIPYGVLKDADVADVVSVSTHPGPVRLQMALRILADQTVSQFDAAHPEGADLVVVPFLPNPDKAALGAWLRGQYARGATILSICAGARNLAEAGLLGGRRATTHWHFIGPLEKAYPRTTWVRDRRYVQDGRIISTTGVSASIPASLAVVEAMAGRERAAQVAARMGVSSWSAAHHSADFPFAAPDLAEAGMTLASPWNHERLEAPVAAGFDEVALALTADAWSATYRASIATTSPTTAPIRSRHGLLLLADARPAAHPRLLPRHGGAPVAQFDLAFADIARRYGPASARVAAKGLEYPRGP
ncbi:DJ-1/PfpI family protein [Caulobacter sp. KR2-114]|uniref:DJ-1/PfpI family protein n=1 Tax=Caulobacter sp. KR2-114 TaxID=3400912 RepID=UPI003BFCC510